MTSRPPVAPVNQPIGIDGVKGLTHNDIKRWRCLMPIYFDAKKSPSEGRKVPLKLAVEYPSIADLIEAAHELKLSAALEQGKSYSRDLMQRGRVRIQVRNEKGDLLNENLSSKRALLKAMAEKIASLPNRRVRVEQEKKLEADSLKAMYEWAASGGKPPTAAATAAAATEAAKQEAKANSANSSPKAVEAPVSGNKKKNRKKK